jgi:hypothetical protein
MDTNKHGLTAKEHKDLKGKTTLCIDAMPVWKGQPRFSKAVGKLPTAAGW